ncbi:hypothetical protein H8356DRAFT_1341647 [Neocallimastix lanati (nom. inval.)]|nr:hypothetical protein H8356DRAFT_1341647 [Neocallimastix sp. JGI-2020a]
MVLILEIEFILLGIVDYFIITVPVIAVKAFHNQESQRLIDIIKENLFHAHFTQIVIIVLYITNSWKIEFPKHSIT